MRVRGVLALEPAQPRWLLIPEQAQQLDTLARQIAIALERVHYVDVAQQAVVRDGIGAAAQRAARRRISHDVRTPLTALIALAESLQRAAGRAPATSASIARAIVAQAHQLHALVNNLLDMARLRKRHRRRRRQPAARLAVGGGGGGLGHPRRAARARRHGGADRAAGRPAAGRVRRGADRARAGQPARERRQVRRRRRSWSARAPPSARWCSRVRDHGPGLPPRCRAASRRCSTSSRAARPNRPRRASGWAWRSARRSSSAHGGEIAAANAAGGGAEFTVTLPRRRAARAGRVERIRSA